MPLDQEQMLEEEAPPVEGEQLPEEQMMDEAPMDDPSMQQPEEKLGSQILRRMYEDIMILMEDYDRMLGPLEEAAVKEHVINFLSGLEAALSDTEGLHSGVYAADGYEPLNPMAADEGDPIAEEEAQETAEEPVAEEGDSEYVDSDVDEPTEEEAYEGMEEGEGEEEPVEDVEEDDEEKSLKVHQKGVGQVVSTLAKNPRVRAAAAGAAVGAVEGGVRGWRNSKGMMGTAAGGAGGAAIGGMVGGPIGAVVGGAVGAGAGHKLTEEDKSIDEKAMCEECGEDPCDCKSFSAKDLDSLIEAKGFLNELKDTNSTSWGEAFRKKSYYHGITLQKFAAALGAVARAVAPAVASGVASKIAGGEEKDKDGEQVVDGEKAAKPTYVRQIPHQAHLMRDSGARHVHGTRMPKFSESYSGVADPEPGKPVETYHESYDEEGNTIRGDKPLPIPKKPQKLKMFEDASKWLCDLSDRKDFGEADRQQAKQFVEGFEKALTENSRGELSGWNIAPDEYRSAWNMAPPAQRGAPANRAMRIPKEPTTKVPETRRGRKYDKPSKDMEVEGEKAVDPHTKLRGELEPILGRRGGQPVQYETPTSNGPELSRVNEARMENIRRRGQEGPAGPRDERVASGKPATVRPKATAMPIVKDKYGRHVQHSNVPKKDLEEVETKDIEPDDTKDLKRDFLEQNHEIEKIAAQMNELAKIL